MQLKGAERRKDKLKTPSALLPTRGRFSPPLLAPVLLSADHHAHGYLVSVIFQALCQAMENQKWKCSSYLLLRNNSKTCGLRELSNLQLSRAQQKQLFSAPWGISWSSTSRGLEGPLSKRLTCIVGKLVLAVSRELSQACGLWTLVPLHVDFSIAFSEAPLPQASSWHGGWVKAEQDSAFVWSGHRSVSSASFHWQRQDQREGTQIPSLSGQWQGSRRHTDESCCQGHRWILQPATIYSVCLRSSLTSNEDRHEMGV